MAEIEKGLPNTRTKIDVPSDEEIAQEEKDRIASEQRALERKRKGRKSTILTGPLGEMDEAETEKKTLLGA